MEFVDTHTHISDGAFDGYEDRFISNAQAAGVRRMLLADIDSSERDAMFAAAARHPGTLFPMLGLYPGSVDGNWRDEIDRMLPYRDKGVVAVGEIGLDYHYGREHSREQKEALAAQLGLAAEWHLPVNIHLRDATEDFFDILEAHAHLGLRGNLHAFSGSYETFRRMQKYGDWYVGIGGVVTFRNASIATDLARIPEDRILLETDAPYLAPTPLRGTRNESANIPLIAEAVARIKGTDTISVAEFTTRNAELLFSI